ncbi:Flp family type IVb pilin [Ferrimonas pelagia]|uniref:Flp family type IVb pilin n=1 Tax=Ferrimonas pelagia TaxID=1177826 RepID=A0ABP9EN73_9GAMM
MLKQALIEFWNDESGLTTVEYAVAGSLVAAALVTAFTDLGEEVGTSISNLCEQVDGDPAANTSGCSS